MAHLRSVLVVVDVTSDSTATRQAAEALASGGTHLHVLALLPDDAFRLADWPLVVHAPQRCTYETTFETARIPAVAREVEAELVILGPWGPPRSPRSRVMTLLDLTKPGGAHVLSVGTACLRVPPRPSVVGILLERNGDAAPVAHELHGLFETPHLVALAHDASEERLDALEVELRSLLPRAEIDVVPFRASPLNFATELGAAAQRHQVELMVAAVDEYSSVAAVITALVSAEEIDHAAAPLLVLKKRGEPPAADRLVSSDTLWVPALGAKVALESVSKSGRVALDATARFHLAGHEASGALDHDEGIVTIPASWFPDGPPPAIGLVPVGNSLKVAAARVASQTRPLVLADAELAPEGLFELEALLPEVDVLFVRMRPTEALDTLRARLARDVPWGGPVGLLDACAWLDDGGAADVPPRVDGQRLLRLALRLRLLGVPVAGIVVRGDEPRPASSLLTVFSVESLRSKSPTAPRLRARGNGHTSRLDVLTSSEALDGHLVRFELDNRRARLETLEAIEHAKTRIHWQCYMAHDDAIAAQFLEAFQRASQRGVEVRLLVDALYSLHDAFGLTNPLLERLAKIRGIEVHGSQPLTGLPSVNDLKHRNHRKLAVIDGRHAIVTGRNLGAAYYSSPSDVTLTPSTAYHEVPWLDASVSVEGPVVEAIERAFLEDWRSIGGAPFDIAPCPVAGDSTCRLVLHRGTRDTHTFDLHLELIESAKTSLVLMNTFPLVVELQRALVRAVRRGVRVQYLLGNVRPRFADGQPFEGGAFRELGDDLVRSRIEPVLRAGAEAWEVALPLEPSWSPSLVRIFPHVHAKLLVRDDDTVAVGSANFDVTSAYWESEALVVVHDTRVAHDALRLVEGLVRHSRPVDVTSEGWRREAPRRAWISEHWPSLVG